MIFRHISTLINTVRISIELKLTNESAMQEVVKFYIPFLGFSYLVKLKMLDHFNFHLFLNTPNFQFSVKPVILQARESVLKLRKLGRCNINMS